MWAKELNRHLIKESIKINNKHIRRCSNQSILKEINPEYSLEGLMLKLKLQYFGPLMWSADSLEKTQMLGKSEGRRRRERQRMRWLGGHHQLNGHEFEQVPEGGEQGSLVCFSPGGRKESDMTECLNNNNIIGHWVHAKSLWSCPTLCNPMDCNPPSSSAQGILQARITGVGCHALLQGIFPTQGLNCKIGPQQNIGIQYYG